MKKLIPVLTGAIMLLSLAACGSRTAAPEATTAPAAAGGKTLVVYFSATGSTKTAAEAIAAATGGDLLELEPAEPYTSADLDYNNADSRVSREHDDETLRDVALKTTTADNWADYDTVYIGYPIWWGIAAWPVDTFVKANDFTGKTVIPFCTSASSGTRSCATFSISAVTIFFTCSASFTGHSTISSSWTCRTSRALSFCFLSAASTRSMASLMISAAVPWIGVLSATRSPKERILKLLLLSSGSSRRRPKRVVT